MNHNSYDRRKLVNNCLTFLINVKTLSNATEAAVL